MNPEGKLAVTLSVAKGRVSDVNVSYMRPLRAARVLAGRTPDEVLRLVPLLFPVCGTAQAIACARALEAALGIAAEPGLEAAREVACLGEAVAAHAWQLGIAWREAAGVAADVAAVREARRAEGALRVALFEGASPGAAIRARPAHADVGAAVATLAAIVHRLADVEPALLDAVRREARAGFGGACTTRAVGHFDRDRAAALLAADPAFSEHPELDGRPIDVSAYARQRASEEVGAVEAEHGCGLLARLVARRADARADVVRLERSLSDLARDVPGAHAHDGASGVGAADTARGPVVHWVQASPAKVSDVRVVAPTDWTFHPRGALRDALDGAEASPTLARDAGWLVLALDPCVPWTLEVRDA